MADDRVTDTNVDTRSNKEPATAHDINEGGAIGAVGGAIVGGLAGGPVGAVIGAIAGGVVSAGAVDVVDKHDNDYERTVAGSNAGMGAYGDYDSDFRAHHSANYAGTGMGYDAYDPAYRYGHGLASDARYQGQDWNAVEPGARSDWESRQPGTWDRFKGPVRHAYDRTKSRV